MEQSKEKKARKIGLNKTRRLLGKLIDYYNYSVVSGVLKNKVIRYQQKSISQGIWYMKLESLKR